MPIFNPRFKENQIEDTYQQGKSDQFPVDFRASDISGLPDYKPEGFFENFQNDFLFAQINEYPETLGANLRAREHQADAGEKLSVEELKGQYVDLPPEIWTEPKTADSAAEIALNFRSTQGIARRYPPRADGTRGVLASALGGISGHLDIKNPHNIIVGVGVGLATAAVIAATAPATLSALAIGALTLGVDALIYTSVEFLARNQYQQQAGIDSTNSAGRFFQEITLGTVLGLPGLRKFNKPRIKADTTKLLSPSPKRLEPPAQKLLNPPIDPVSDVPVDIVERMFPRLGENPPQRINSRAERELIQLKNKLDRYEKQLLFQPEDTRKFQAEQAQIEELFSKIFKDESIIEIPEKKITRGHRKFNKGKLLTKKQEVDTLNDTLDRYFNTLYKDNALMTSELKYDLEATKQFLNGEEINLNGQHNPVADAVDNIVSSHEIDTGNINPAHYGQEFSTPVKSETPDAVLYDKFQAEKNKLTEHTESKTGELLNETARVKRTAEELDNIEVEIESKLDTSITNKSKSIDEKTIAPEFKEAKAKVDADYKMLKNEKSILEYIKCRLGK